MTTIVDSCGFDWPCGKWQEVEKDVWRNDKTGRTYGSLSRDSHWVVRGKCFELIIGFAAVIPFLRMPYRIFALLSGDSYRAGKEKAKDEWQLELQKWQASGKSEPLPSETLIYVKNIAWQLAKNIAKIVTYPFALIGLLFASLYGVLDPKNGRLFISSIEDAWSRDIIPGDFALSASEYLAPCMQPRDVWDEKDLYGFDRYDPRSWLLRIQTTLEKEFFKKEPVEDQESYLKDIRTYRSYNVEKPKTRDHLEILSAISGILDRIQEVRANPTKLAAIASLKTKMADLSEVYKQIRKQPPLP